MSANQKRYLDLGSYTSSVWNFCTRYSEVIFRGLKWRLRETSAVFSGYRLGSCVTSSGQATRGRGDPGSIPVALVQLSLPARYGVMFSCFWLKIG